MKKLRYFLFILMGIGLFAACKNDLLDQPIIEEQTNADFLSTPIDPADLPQAILDYIAANFPDATIIEAEEHDNNGNITYEVDLDNGLDLIFAPDGTLLAMDSSGSDDDDDNSGPDSDGVEISAAELPQAILEYINTNYPGAVILFAELENDGSYEVYLDVGVELHFDSNGQFLNADDDGDDDGLGDDDNSNNDDDDGDNSTPIDPATLPQTILDYIATNYPEATIILAELEDNGNYEVYLDNGLELEFDANGNLLNIDDNTNDDDDNSGSGNDDDDDTSGSGNDDITIDPASLPQVILDYIATNYPNATIILAEIDGDTGNYEVYLDNGFELNFDPDGNFLSVDGEEDDDDTSGGGGDSTPIPIDQLPANILNTVSNLYPDATILCAEINTDGSYEVSLDNGRELDFDANGNLISDELDNDGHVAPEDLPQAALDYIATNYPDATILCVETDDDTGNYEVYLDNGLWLEFTPDGTFVP